MGESDGGATMSVFDPLSSRNRVPPDLYVAVRDWLLANDPDAERMLNWARSGRAAPLNSAEMASQVIWIILCAGRSAQAARTIERKVWDAIAGGRPVVEAFGYRAKAAAIERAWRERDTDFSALQRVLSSGDVGALVDWCGELSFVGDDTKYQLAKNFGADLCKPDIWLCRLSGIADRPRRPLKTRFAACMALCGAIAEATGDSIAVIDSMLWLACNKGTLQVAPDTLEITWHRGSIRRAEIIV